MISLFEKFRPQTFDQVVGQDKALARLKVATRNGYGGRAYWLTGRSGTGKTTIGRIIARELADDSCVIEIDAQDVTLDFLRDIERNMGQYGLGKGGRVWIFNEVHRLRGPVVTRLLTVLEPARGLPDHVAFIFTTTFEGEELLFDDVDSHPLVGRCVQLRLSVQGWSAPASEYLADIVIRENLNGYSGEPMEEYRPKLVKRCARLVNDCNGSLREALSRIDAGELCEV